MFSGKEDRAIGQGFQQKVDGVFRECSAAVFVDIARVPGPAPSVFGPVLDHRTFKLFRSLTIENDTAIIESSVVPTSQ